MEETIYARALAFGGVVILSTALAHGQDINTDALRELDLFARSFCNEYLPVRPEAVPGRDANTEMDSFLHRLSSLGVADAIDFDGTIYAAALVAETASKFDPARSCRLQIWTDLRPVIVPTVH